MAAEFRRARLHPDTPFVPAGRSAFAIDRDRVLATGEFWRLRDVTQVMTPSAPGHYHNRLTHSLTVAHIGRRMATALLGRAGDAGAAMASGGLDPDVVEAACLAHDLGHPPFGHDAEDELNLALIAAGVAGGFEANAQTFRIVTTLASAGAGVRGLNLTRATTAAILKYPWTRDASPIPGKWGVYESEAADLAWARERSPAGCLEPTLEAAVMDLADLIAYAVHDFEDFLCTGAIPMKRLATNLTERDRLLGLVVARREIPASEHDDLARILDRTLATCPGTGQRAERASVGRFAAGRVDEFIQAVRLAEGRSGAGAVVIDRERELEILLLEGLTWHYVIDSDLLYPQRTEQRRIIRELFEALADAAMSGPDMSIFPSGHRDRLRAAESHAAKLRMVADVIASLSEEEAMTRVTGRSR